LNTSSSPVAQNLLWDADRQIFGKTSSDWKQGAGGRAPIEQFRDPQTQEKSVTWWARMLFKTFRL
jgi:hypothetical protein